MNYLVRIYSGRLSRKQYGLGLLLCAAILLLFSIGAAVLLPTLAKVHKGSAVGGTVVLILLLITVPAYIAHVFSLHVRRLHSHYFFTVLSPAPVRPTGH